MPIIKGKVLIKIKRTARKDYSYPVISFPNIDKEMKEALKALDSVNVSFPKKKNQTE